MRETIYLIGTDHNFQVGGEDCDKNDALQFKQYLQFVCEKYSILRIAEEINDEGIAKYKGMNTIGNEVADELSIKHKKCDPTNKERVAEGIEGRGEVIISAKMKKLDQEKIEELLAIEEIKREKFWLRRIAEESVYPTLFICGANHTTRFASLIEKNGFNAEILSSDWSPNKSIQPTADASAD